MSFEQAYQQKYGKPPPRQEDYPRLSVEAMQSLHAEMRLFQKSPEEYLTPSAPIEGDVPGSPTSQIKNFAMIIKDLMNKMEALTNRITELTNLIKEIAIELDKMRDDLNLQLKKGESDDQEHSQIYTLIKDAPNGTNEVELKKKTGNTLAYVRQCVKYLKAEGKIVSKLVDKTQTLFLKGKESTSPENS